MRFLKFKICGFLTFLFMRDGHTSLVRFRNYDLSAKALKFVSVQLICVNSEGMPGHGFP
jgi:hypothetical protein